ncbi:MAG: tRNA (adenosine(37)-N6)-threonylcarbamoyltransferase complex dimerization subunit type 1 TsaB [Elusimicrobiaceae bacterium]|nr:tRNA (adenosine(37)-N6)-threonylcarbamoyltransferase complex dimerization subunit type 1 TsaB [Elusimicrobiaceae bacterium]
MPGNSDSGKAVLAIDSSNAPLRLALVCAGRVLRASRAGVKQEEYLFPAVLALLGKAGLRLRDISRVCVLRGPGRFTGLRIGLTFAAMLRELNGASVRAGTVFMALAYQTARSASYLKWKTLHDGGKICVVLHAFRSEYFCQFINADGTRLSACGEPRWLNRAELLDFLAGAQFPFYCVGRAECGAALGTVLPRGYALAPEKDCRLDPAALAEFAAGLPEAETPVSPLYLKPARFELAAPGL